MNRQAWVRLAVAISALTIIGDCRSEISLQCPKKISTTQHIYGKAIGWSTFEGAKENELSGARVYVLVGDSESEISEERIENGISIWNISGLQIVVQCYYSGTVVSLKKQLFGASKCTLRRKPTFTRTTRG